MSDLGRVLRLDARRTALLIAVPVLIVIGAAAAIPSLYPSAAYWDNTVIALVNAVRFLGPVAAGLAAWAAVRERPLDYLRDLTARSPATGVLFDLLLLSSAALVSYGAVTVLVVAVTLAQQEAGQPHPLGMIAGAGALVLHVVVGYLMGRVIPNRATAALAFGMTLLWAALRLPGVSWWSLLPPAAFPRIDLFTTLRPRVFADQVLWTAGLTAVLILGYVLWVTRRFLLVLPLVTALAATVTATLGLQGSGGGTVRALPAQPVCRQWPVVVCVHPALREALPNLMEAVVPLAARLSGTPGAFTRVEQRPSWMPVSVAHGVAFIHLDEDLSPGYAARAARQISDALKDSGTCADGYRALVDAWLLGDEPPSITDTRAARLFASLGEYRRRAWLNRHFTEYRTCTLGPGDFRPAPSRPARGSARGRGVSGRHVAEPAAEEAASAGVVQ
ncbi:hypothetical protein [Actinomadura formosensis]|uniref:hypothetical protein n=1 Tax=Actinomadura formosensis TaxID=60706 RepID=UPI000AC3B9F1|nr:hypothetical protein [Actinomadura formosensis]